MTQRADLLGRLCEKISGMRGRVIVAVDGVDGAGKSRFASELASALVKGGCPVVHTTVDGFHNERAVRYRRGKSDPLGFFEDSYNYPLLLNELIDPFRQGASTISVACFDHKLDAEVKKMSSVPAGAILLIDGIFLHRNELANLWDYSIFLSVPFAVSYARMAERDGSDPDPLAPGNVRYHQGQKFYLETCKPELRASIVIDNAVIETPRVLLENGQMQAAVTA